MCGISGVIGTFGPEVVVGLERMHAALEHRGPDAEGSWILDGPADRPRVAFKHRRLSIIDLSAAGNQPMQERASGNWIVFNGEIYNHRHLRSELEPAGRRFASRSDTEVLLAAYGAWGARCIERLRGMFAFAVYDAGRRQVFLARDRLGKKPLYVAEIERDGERCLLFASEVRALLESGLVERRLDRVGLATYLWNGFVRGPGTIVRDVRMFPPGSTAVVGLDDPRLDPQRYWRIPQAGSGETTRSSDPAELRTEVARAVELRLESDVDLGVFLSGGVDSSAVASLAVRSGVGEVRTFNVGFDEPDHDESAHARAIAERLGTRHDELRLDAATFRATLPSALESLDQPTFDGLNTYFVSRAVREAGIRVALAGTGGDELFGGYRSFVDLPRARGWSQRLSPLPEALLRRGARAVARAELGPFGEVPPQTRWGKLGDVLGTRGALVPLYQISYALYTREFLQELAPDLQQACNVRDGMPAEVHDELARETEAEPLLHAIARLELEGFLGERLLRDTDATSMSVALEVRLPLVDHRVIERCVGLDEDTRFKPLLRKELLRSAALSELDPAHFDRPKSGFVLPLERWCRNELSGEVSSALCDGRRWSELGLDPHAVARLWRAFQAGAPGLYWSRVWSLFVLSWWCRRHRVCLG